MCIRDSTTINTFVFDLATSIHTIEDRIKQQKFVFSPNPFQHGFLIRAIEPLDQKFELRLYTLEQKLVQVHHINATEEIHISRGELPSGLYICQIVDGKTGELIQVGKVVAVK